ncbi:hypothetical protein LCGC14_3156490 [marine sediment metagenome]|uniref:Uncharacterized protein n=1 Tax=marine sediment metagenome TaxID=412755 RepID=A0A0F8XZ92_9ZZZZ
MLTVEDVIELISMTIQDAPPDLKKLFYETARMDGTDIINGRIKMLTTQKTISIIKHDKNTLPILDYIDTCNFIALSLNGGVILWVYRGMSMLIPAARIANKVRHLEMMNKAGDKKTLRPKFVFTTEDAIMLPKKIADALLGGDV